MKTSDKITLVATAIGIIAGLGLYWMASGLPWWAYVGLVAIVAGGLRHEMLKRQALENVANMNDRH